MNYTNIYNQLITRAQSRTLNEYTELHHVIPRCMDGTNEHLNLVELTPSEHLIAHLLLVKIHPGVAGLWYAANMMTNRFSMNNKQYGWVRRGLSEIATGVPRSAESVQKQRDTVATQFANGRIGCRAGSTLTDSHKFAISLGNVGKVVPTRSRSSLEGYQCRYGIDEGTRLYDEHRLKKDSGSLRAYIQRYGADIGQIKYDQRVQQKRMLKLGKPGMPHTEAAKKKISEAKIGKKVHRTAEHNAKIGAANKGKKLPMFACTHCGLIAPRSNIGRWHNDNCKFKP